MNNRDKSNFIKIKKCCASEVNINRMKMQPTKQESVLASYKPNKKLISRIYKEVLQLNTKKHSFKKWAKDLNRQFSKENIQIAKKHIKRYSASLIIREM